MSTKDAEEFIRSVMSDSSLLKEVNERVEFSQPGELSEEALREEMGQVVPGIAEEHGYDFTAEEGFEVLDNLRRDGDSDSLSDAELEQVAGGKDGEEVALSVFSAGFGCDGGSVLTKPKADCNW